MTDNAKKTHGKQWGIRRQKAGLTHEELSTRAGLSLRKLKAIQLHRFTADGKTVSGLTATGEETRSIFQQLDLPLPDTKALQTS